MDSNLLQLLVCSVLTLVGLVIVAIIWKRAAIRTIVWWLGLALLPIGLYLVGLVPLLVDGWNTLVQWYAMLAVTPVAITGAVIGGLGIVLMLVSRLIPYRKRTITQPAGATASTPGTTPARPLAPRPATGSAPLAPRSQGTPTHAGEYDEVTEILKRRGIE